MYYYNSTVPGTVVCTRSCTERRRRPNDQSGSRAEVCSQEVVAMGAQQAAWRRSVQCPTAGSAVHALFGRGLGSLCLDAQLLACVSLMPAEEVPPSLRRLLQLPARVHRLSVCTPSRLVPPPLRSMWVGMHLQLVSARARALPLPGGSWAGGHVSHPLPLGLRRSSHTRAR